jgi:hypothetical protein
VKDGSPAAKPPVRILKRVEAPIQNLVHSKSAG